MPASRASSASGFDAVVVGGGVIGLAIAWRAVSRGLQVAVLEAGRAGHGATRAAAGMLAPVTEASFGEQELVSLNLESARRYAAFAGELEAQTGIDAEYRPCGTLAVALDRDDAELLKRLNAFQLSLGLDAEWLRAKECRALEPSLSPGVVGGIRAPLDHAVNPRALAQALVQAIRSAGAELWEDSPVERVLLDGDRVAGVELGSGERLLADRVVVAAGWRSAGIGGLPEEAAVPVRPVKGQIVRLRADASLPPAGRVVRTTEVYVVPRAGGEVIVGATVEERGDDTAVTAGGVLELLREAYRVLPGIYELELVEASAGLRPGTTDNLPIIGPGAVEGLVWATGHWRNGILLAPVTADAVSELLADGSLPDVVRPFSPARFGPVREAAVGGAGAGAAL